MPTRQETIARRRVHDSMFGRLTPSSPFHYSSFSHSQKTGSTMEDARLLARQGNPAPFVLSTDHQTRGVGRGDGRVWHDRKEASVMFSIFFSKDDVDENVLPEFSDMVGLQACMAVRETAGLDVKIKWPNDLVVNDRKLAGILAQPVYDDNNEYLGVILGLGMNVHYGKKALQRIPADYPPTSLDVERRGFTFRPVLATAILEKIRYSGTYAYMVKYNSVAADEFNALWEEYSALLHRDVEVLKDNIVLLRGEVTSTKIGAGIVIANSHHVDTFETNMKVRIAR